MGEVRLTAGYVVVLNNHVWFCNIVEVFWGLGENLGKLGLRFKEHGGRLCPENDLLQDFL